MSETLERAPAAVLYALGVHAASEVTVVALDEYLALRPEARGEIVTGSRDFMGLYQRLFEELREGVCAEA